MPDYVLTLFPMKKNRDFSEVEMFVNIPENNLIFIHEISNSRLYKNST